MICHVKICIVSGSHDRADALERTVNDTADTLRPVFKLSMAA